MGDIWGVVLGAGLTAIFGLVGLLVSHKREHKQWLRNEKKQIYMDSLQAMDDIHDSLRKNRSRMAKEDPEPLIKAEFTTDFVAPLEILAPNSVMEACHAFLDAINAMLERLGELINSGNLNPDDEKLEEAHQRVNSVRRDFIDEAKKDLNI